MSTSSYPQIKLAETSAPGLAYGVGTAWFKNNGRELTDSVKLALKAGYTHLDNAQAYANEEAVGIALAESKIPRDKLFITTKLGSGFKDIKGTLEKQLKLLQTDYVDLYLIHWPYDLAKEGSSQEEAWAQMEQVKEAGLAREIGVSNYRISDLERTLKAVKKHRPVINQIELHPYIYKESKALLDYMEKENIAVAAYAPSAPVTKDPEGPVGPVLAKVAKSLSDRTGTQVEPSQVLLKLAAQRGYLVVTTTSKESRMQEQLKAGALPDLSQDEIEEISNAGAQKYQRFFMKHMEQP